MPRAHRHAAHVLHAARDHALVLAGHHAHRREVGGLLAGAAHAVERRAADVQRKAGDQGGVAGDVEPLLAHLVHAAHHHVLDLARVDLHARHQGLERVGQEVVRAIARELAVLPADGGTDRADDHRVLHGGLLIEGFMTCDA
jgi:hypothetical protein